MKFSRIKYSIPAMLLLFSTYAQATTVKEVVQHTMVKNPEIMSLLKNNEAFRYYIDEEEGGYYPKIDLTTYVGTKRTKTDTDAGTKTTTNQDGYNAQLDLEQMLYDGGFTSARIEEARRKSTSNEYNNRNRVENIMFESITAYLGMVKADEVAMLTTENLRIHDEYMVTATQNEEISGESLNRIQVSAKLHFAKNQLLEEEKNKKNALSNFEKSVGMQPEGYICRPNLNDNLIPGSVQDIIELALKHNYEILEQIENIKEQRAIIQQEKSNFLPKLTFKAQAILDEDLTSDETGTNTYSGRIELKYNLFNGNKDSNVKQREILFLQESQKTLDTITRDVVDRLTVAYDNYQVSKEQIFELKQYVSDNLEILAIYQDQFEGGTRTFLDVLNAEGDIYNSKTSLVDAEYVQLDAYYEMFSILSTLNTTVLASQDQVCKQMQIITKKKEKEDPSIDELSDLLEEEPASTPEAPAEKMEEEPKETPAEEPVEKMEEKTEAVEEVMKEKKAEVMTPVEETPVEMKTEVVETVTKTEPVKVATTAMSADLTLNGAMLKEFSHELQSDVLTYNITTKTLKLSESFLKLSDSGVVMSADYKELIRDIFPRLVRVTKAYENEIAEVKVEGHSSSMYAGVEDVQRKFELNQVISLQRAKTVLGYGANLDVSTITDNSDFVSNTYKAYGLSSEYIVTNPDGTENQLLSKRVEFVIIPK